MEVFPNQKQQTPTNQPSPSSTASKSNYTLI